MTSDLDVLNVVFLYLKYHRFCCLFLISESQDIEVVHLNIKRSWICFQLTMTVTDESLFSVLPHQTDEFVKASGLNITTTACSQRLNPHQPLMLFLEASGSLWNERHKGCLMEMWGGGAEIESALVLSSPEDSKN